MISRSSDIETVFAPARALPVPTAADEIERQQALSFFETLQIEDVIVSGYLASRKPQSPFATEAERSAQQAADYRTYVGVQYARNVGDFAQISNHTFYGAGTYSGDNSYIAPEAGALPSVVQPSAGLVGEWLGTDLQLRSRVFERHTVHAGLEYRQQLAMDLFQQDKLFGKTATGASNGALYRKMDFIAGSEIALASALSLNAGVRFDENAAAQRNLVDPRVELRYTPEQNTTLRAMFSQAVDTTGFEVGMERRQFGGARTSLSYAWQQLTTTAVDPTYANVGRHLAKVSLGVPVWGNRLSTGFELQYHDLVGPFDRERNKDFLIGNLTLANGELARDTQLSFGVRNVFGVREDGAATPLMPFIPYDGRSLSFDLKRKF